MKTIMNQFTQLRGASAAGRTRLQGWTDAHAAFVKVVSENPALKPSNEWKMPSYQSFVWHARHVKLFPSAPLSCPANHGNVEEDDDDKRDVQESASTSSRSCSSDKSINLLLSAAETMGGTNAPPPLAAKSEVKAITLDVACVPRPSSSPGASTSTTVPVPVLMPTTNNGGGALGTPQSTRPDAEPMTTAVTLAAAAASSLRAANARLRKYTRWTPQLVRPVPQQAYHHQSPMQMLSFCFL